MLQLTLALSLVPDGAAQAKASREQLLRALAAQSGAWPALAKVFAAGESEALSKLALSPDDKACALYLLAAQQPQEARAACLERAARYDLGRRYPHALLERARAALSGK